MQIELSLSYPYKIIFALTASVLLAVSASAANVKLQITATQPGLTNPVCVRAIIKKSNGSFVSGEWGNSSYPSVPLNGVALEPGSILSIPRGTTQITVGKGPDFLPQTITTNLNTGGQTYSINFVLQPALDLYGKGWRGGDTHIHYFHGEYETNRSPSNAWAMCAAATVS